MATRDNMMQSSSCPSKIVIVGRPNVGKSTLFNRLVGSRRALVHNQPGVTRDRLEQTTDWWLHGFPTSVCLVDTGGLGGDRFAAEIEAQVELALHQAQVVLFVLDTQVGVTDLDRELFRRLKQKGIQNLIAILNKVDHEKHGNSIYEFYELAFADFFPISAEHGLGIDDLKNEVLEKYIHPFLPPSLPDSAALEEPGSTGEEKKEFKKGPPRIAIVGRPNVGKSTLINALVGRQRVITSSIAGTTIDSIDVPVLLGDHSYLLMDTAGVRRKDRTEQGVEVLSVIQTKKALERADLAVLLLDGETGVVDQDEKIGGWIQELGCSVILVVNKWDTQKRNWSEEEAAKWIRSRVAYLNYAPLIFISALLRKNLEALDEVFSEVLKQKRVKVQTHELTEWVRREATIHNPKDAHFYLCHQTSQHPPSFVCHVNDPKKVVLSLRRHLVNALRERWGYLGTPVRLLIKEAQNRKSLPRKKHVG